MIRFAMLLGLAVLLAATARAQEPAPLIDADGGTLRLRAQAVAVAPHVRLADVLSFADAAPQLCDRLADAAVLTDQQPGARVDVTHEAIVQRLRELGVNLARVTISGAANCAVEIAADTESPPTNAEDAPATAQKTRPEQAADGTLGGAIRALVAEELHNLGGVPEIEFERAADSVLALSAPRYEFTIRTSDHEKLGLREFQVTIRADGKNQRTLPVSARVRLSKPVLVARKPLNLGSFVKLDDVAVETRLFDAASRIGVSDPRALVGHQVARFVPAGQMVSAADVKSVDMVARSQRVAVVGGGDSVQLRLEGVALDAGTHGSTVRVRLGDAKGERRIRRGTVTDFGTVRLID